LPEAIAPSTNYVGHLEGRLARCFLSWFCCPARSVIRSNGLMGACRCSDKWTVINLREPAAHYVEAANEAIFLTVNMEIEWAVSSQYEDFLN
jgi:hypothetical protein